MKEWIVEFQTLSEAYNAALKILGEHGDVVDCSDWGTRCKELSMTMVVKEPLTEPRVSLLAFCTPEALDRYLSEMIDGSLDWAIEAGKEPYTYHDRIVNYFGIDQLQFCADELKRNPSSRRAVVSLRRPADINSGDPACLQHIQFFIRDGKLDMCVLFRSNDAVKATFMNAYALIEIQKKVADAIGVSVGTYTHRANSFHAYECDWSRLAKVADRVAAKKRVAINSETYFKWAK